MKKRKPEVIVKFMLKGGEATPAPPVGTTLGQYRVRIADFCTLFNEKSRDRKGDIIPVIVNIYKDGSFDFIMKKCSTSFLLKRACGILKGSGEPDKLKVGRIKKEEIRKIAEYKLDEMNTRNIDIAMKTIEGTAQSMGLLIEE